MGLNPSGSDFWKLGAKHQDGPPSAMSSSTDKCVLLAFSQGFEAEVG